MSLVVALRRNGWQIWCSDGRTLEQERGSFKIADERVCKIRKGLRNNILVGWAGDRVHANRAIDDVLAQEYQSVQMLLETLGDACLSINSKVNHEQLLINEAPSHTGFVAGGFIEGEQFLSVVAPNGDAYPMEKWSAIGSGAEAVSGRLGQIARSHDSMRDTYDQVLALFPDAARRIQLMKGCIPSAYVGIDMLGDSRMASMGI